MAGICIEKLSHSCGSKDGLQVFQDEKGEYSGYCFSCSTFIQDPYENGTIKPNIRTRTSSQNKEDLAEITTYPSKSLPDRRLEEWALAHFGVKVALSEEDGETPVARYFPFTKDGEIKRYKAKLMAEKKMYWIGEKDEVDMFGWEQAIASGSDKLFITEGEDDAVAVYQAIIQSLKGTKWEGSFEPAIISLTNGASSAKKEIARNSRKIKENFKEVRIVFDNDEAGKNAVRDVINILPQAQVVTVPGKDANECVIEGRSKALATACSFKSKVAKTTRLVWGSSLHEAGRTPPEWGISWPWEGLTELTRGMRFGETYYLGAGVKMGKSELVNTLAAHLITTHGLKVFMAKPEEVNKKSYQLICGKVAGKIFHDPKIEFDFDAYDKASALVGDNVCLLDLYQRMSWNDLRDDIHSAVSQGCKAVFIDPITNLTNGINAGEANTLLQDFAQELSAISLELQILSFIFCHLKAPESGEAHERGGKVFSHQFAGSRAMMRSCNMMIGLEGNKDPDLDEEERNMRRLVILEDREFGSSGIVNLYWDRYTGLFNEVKK